MDKLLTGFLQKVSNGNFFMETADGEFTQVRFITNTLAESTPINQKIAVHVTEVNGDWVIGHTSPHYLLLEEAASLIVRDLIQGVFVLIDPDRLDVSDSLLKMGEQIAYHNRAFAMEYYRHLRPVEVRHFVVPTIGGLPKNAWNPEPPYYASAGIADFIAKGGTGGWTPVYYQVVGGESTRYCGLGHIGGERSMIFMNCTAKNTTGPHEWGHNLGENHSSSEDNLGLKEYGDYACFMGGN